MEKSDSASIHLDVLKGQSIYSYSPFVVDIREVALWHLRLTLSLVLNRNQMTSNSWLVERDATID